MASIYKRGGKANRDGCYYITYSIRPCERRTVRGCRDKAATEALAKKLETEAWERQKGLVDARADQYARAEAKPVLVRDQDAKPASGHLADFCASLLAKGGTEKNVSLVRTRAARVIELCGIERLSELVPSAVQAAIAALRDEEGLSLQTCNHYLRAIKQFSRWLRRDGRLREDPLSHLAGYNVSLDRRHDRRALTREELVRLVSAAETGATVMGMTGPDRAMLYRVAVGTGFRVGELRSLTPESFDLGGDFPTITVQAAYSKRRRRDVQEIRPELATLLRAWLSGKPKGAPAFAMPDKGVRLLRADLAAAGIPYRDTAGRYADLHALRHTAGTLLQEAGVHPKQIQDFMRHSTITLTMDRYTHVGIRRRREALHALPVVTPGSPDEDGAKGTGTDDAAATTDGPDRRAAHSAARKHPGGPTSSIGGHREQARSEGTQGAQRVTKGSTCRRTPASATTTPGGTRTHDLRFRKPPLYPAELRAYLVF